MDKQENDTQVSIESEFINKLNISDKDSNQAKTGGHKNYYCYCNRPFTKELRYRKCDSCHIIEGWTSGNSDVDKFIKDTMYGARKRDFSAFLEWIPFDRFKDIKQIGE